MWVAVWRIGGVVDGTGNKSMTGTADMVNITDMEEVLKKIESGEAAVIESEQPEQTFELGRLLGQGSRIGQVYTLVGDLGAGKTVFAQGFAAGLGVQEPVNSPTFTILQVYEEGRLPFYHFDVYRIGSVEEMDEIGYEDCIYGGGVCLIEWANLIEEILPEQYFEILMERNQERGFDYRRITVGKRCRNSRG